MTAHVIEVGGCRIHVLPVIKGLTSEAIKVKAAFDRVKPDKVAISLSREEVEGLKAMPRNFVHELSRYEERYAHCLGRFGAVAAPPPCYVAAVELADHAGLPLVPVDLDESSYTELYCVAVSGSALFRHSTRTWLLRLRRFGATTPEEFVLAWDRAVNGLQAFRTIEAKRARAMAGGVLSAAKGSKNLLAVIELERANEVAELIREHAGSARTNEETAGKRSGMGD
ncbi:MAG: hypothetical protein ACUVT7_04345 [Thermoplasmata archaeon]